MTDISSRTPTTATESALEAWPPWWKRVGGRRAITRQEAMIGSLFGVFAVLVGNATSITSLRSGLTWTLAGIIAVAFSGVCVVVFEFVTRKFSKSGRSWSLGYVVVGGFAVGAMYGIGLSLAVVALDLPSTRTPLERILTSAIFVELWSIAIRLVIDGRNRMHAQRDALLEQAVALEITRLRRDAVDSALRDQVDVTVASGLSAARTQIAELQHEEGPPLSVWPQFAETLRAAAEQSARPLSRELLAAAEAQRSIPRPISLLRYVIDRQPFRPIAVVALYLVTTGIGTVSDAGIARGLPLVCTVAVIISGLMLGANALMRLWQSHHRAIFLATLALLQTGVVFSNPLRALVGQPPIALVEIFADILAWTVLILLTSAYGAMRKMDAEHLEAIRLNVAAQRVEQIARGQHLSELLREASAVVHGAVQSRLLACAFAVEHAAASNDVEQLSSALEAARDVLNQPVLLTAPANPGTLGAEVQRKQLLWSGLCEIDVQMDDASAALSGPIAVNAGRVVEEAIANAVRHGAARRVTATISHDDAGLTAIVDDDGCAHPEAAAVTGLGSRLYTEVSEGDWNLTTSSTGARLRVHLPTPS